MKKHRVQIVAASMHWNGDGPDGTRINSTIRFAGPDDSDRLIRELDRNMLQQDATPWDQKSIDHQKSAEYLRKLLIAAASRIDWWNIGCSPPHTIGWIVLNAISWLETRGFLESDEYNGVLWLATRGKQFISMRWDAHSNDKTAKVAAIFAGVGFSYVPGGPKEMQSITSEITGRKSD